MADTHTIRPLRTALADGADPDTDVEWTGLAQAAACACGMPMAVLSLADGGRLGIAAGFGLRDAVPLAALLAATAERRDPLVIPDMRRDPGTAGHPLVTGAPQVRFYAGVPLTTSAGAPLGALAVLDTRPGALSTAQNLVLQALARQAATILDLRQALRARRESDRRAQAILDSAVDYGILSTDLTGHVTSWNVGAERVLGWTEAEMLGRSADVIFTEADRAAGIPEAEMGAALRHGRGTDERWHRKKDGSRFWANGEIMPLTDEGGKPEGFIKILRDRTEQRDAAARNQADAAFMRSVLGSSADCIKVLDLDARLTFMNEGGLKTMEVSDFNAIRGCPWPDFWRDQGHADAVLAIETARAGGIGHFQGLAETFLGTPKWWDVQVTPILGPEGKPDKLLSVSRDITGQKRVEAELAASEARWRGLFLGMQEGFFLGELVRDAAGRAIDYRFLEINPAFARQSGLPGDVAGRTIRSIVPDIDQDVIDRYARVVETGEPILFEIGVPSLGRDFEVRVNREQDARFRCLFLDITDRKRGERRRAAMTELGDRLRDVGDKTEILRVAAEITGQVLGLSHCGYGQVDPEKETVLVTGEWTAPGRDSLAGLHDFRAYGSYIACLKAGADVVIPDVTGDSRTAADASALIALGGRALLNLPVTEHGRFVGLFYALRPEAAAWNPDDIGFARAVADRTRAAIARVEAEERQHLINQELSHRLKNTLALVQSIASQTLRRAGDMNEAREALDARLVALGKAHDILLRGRGDGAALTVVIAEALALHQDRAERFAFSGPDLLVSPSAALALGLILHELATNATKYGALSRPGGQVGLTWTIRDTDGKATFQLVWTERGGPPVTPPSRTGFGSRLIQRGLSSGTVESDYRPSGLVCTLTTPLHDLAAIG